MTASDLSNSFQGRPAKSSMMYKRKKMTVSGIVSGYGDGRHGIYVHLNNDKVRIHIHRDLDVRPLAALYKSNDHLPRRRKKSYRAPYTILFEGTGICLGTETNRVIIDAVKVAKWKRVYRPEQAPEFPPKFAHAVLRGEAAAEAGAVNAALVRGSSGTLPQSLVRGLVAHFSFDRDSHSSIRSTTGTVRGKVNNAAWVRDDRESNNAGALQFNGETSYVDLPPKTVGNWNQLTYSVWVKMPQYVGENWPAFIGSHAPEKTASNISIGLYQGRGVMHMDVDTNLGNKYLRGQHRIPWDRWFHAVMVYDGLTLREYMDGVPGAGVKVSGELNSLGYLALGRHSANYSGLRGMLDDVMIYDRALSPEEVKALYRAQGGKRP
jgi:hypothetical protein